MKPLFLFLLICAFYWSTVSAGSLKRQSRSFGDKVGIPLVFHDDSEPVLRTGIASKGDKEKTNKQAEDENDDDESEDDEDMNDDKSDEEKGLGYENIKGMEPNDDAGNSTAGSKGGKIDLNADFPPNADEVYKLPKEVDMTAEQLDRKMMEKKKGYLSFTIKQRFKPEYKFKESPAYKILSGNVIHDVERALKTTGAVKDILFREAKDERPYQSKVEVFVKVKQKINQKRLKKTVDRGLINGMITIPGSFHANFVEKLNVL